MTLNSGNLPLHIADFRYKAPLTPRLVWPYNTALLQIISHVKSKINTLTRHFLIYEANLLDFYVEPNYNKYCMNFCIFPGWNNEQQYVKYDKIRHERDVKGAEAHFGVHTEPL